MIVDFRSNALRPATWTSADAAGLPIAPGLVTYDEMQSGEIKHAIRFTVPQTRREYVWPARHYASSLTGTQYPRMGERFRLSGVPDPRWNDDHLQMFGQLLGSNFEAVDATLLRIEPNSGAAIQSGVSVAVSPSAVSVRVGHFQSFSATVTGAAAGVTWSVNDIASGDPVVGTIDGSGQYLPPSTAPNPRVVTVRATSVAAPTASATASVTILAAPSITSITPSSLGTGDFTLVVTGAELVIGSVITFDGGPLATTFVSATTLTAAGNAPSARSSVPVDVRTPDGDVSNTVYVSVTAVAVGIVISPASTSVRVRQTRQFVATVNGAGNTSAKWSVNGIVGGNGTIGTISPRGLYRAPHSVPGSTYVSVSATAAADSSKTATALVTISKS